MLNWNLLVRCQRLFDLCSTWLPAFSTAFSWLTTAVSRILFLFIWSQCVFFYFTKKIPINYNLQLFEHSLTFLWLRSTKLNSLIIPWLILDKMKFPNFSRFSGFSKIVVTLVAFIWWLWIQLGIEWDDFELTISRVRRTSEMFWSEMNESQFIVNYTTSHSVPGETIRHFQRVYVTR